MTAVLAGFLPCGTTDARAAKPPLCSAGRFVGSGSVTVQGETLAIVLRSRSISIGEACAPARARLKRTKLGTSVRAAWRSCRGLSGRVRLKAFIDPTCTRIAGNLTTHPGLRTAFAATATVCGDGYVDRVRGEACEADAQCEVGQQCTSCQCEPGSTTTTTLPGLQASDFLMFSGVETADPLEVMDDTCGGDDCMPVTSPVRTGTYACQIAMDTFTGLRPCRGFEVSEVFARVYHRIDVVTPPAAEAFAPVIVFDARVPTGVTEVDVGVQPDGMIRYRLRDRLLEEDLGFSEVLPAGEWVQVELGTHMGAGTGSAEMRLNGETVAQAAGLDLTDETINGVFISNNADRFGGPNGGVWTATFDDIAVTINHFPGAGRVIGRQGRPGAPTYQQWALLGAASIDAAWSDTPSGSGSRAETPVPGDNVNAQTMLVAPLDAGVDAAGPQNEIKVCQTWLDMGVTASPADRTYAIRRRIGGVDQDVILNDLGTTTGLRSDALSGAFWTAPLDALATAEIGAVRSGGAGGSGMRVDDAWLMCEYE